MKRKFLRAGIGLVLMLTVTNRESFGAETMDSVTADEVYLVRGELATLRAQGLTRLSVTDPAVADIVNADEDKILVVGQAAGQTALFVWDTHGKRTVMIHVFNQDLELIKDRLKQLLKAVNIHEATLEVSEKEGKVLVSGDIPKHKKAQFDQIVGPFSADVMNMAREEEVDDLIQVDIQVTELSTTLSKLLGIDWSTGAAFTPGTSFTPVYGENLPGFDGSLGDYFKIGKFNRSSDSILTAKVNALITQGKARVLSRPKLVVVSGQSASFLVGGEIPIRTTLATAAGGTQTTTENVTFKPYGISMTVTPTIKKEKIDIHLTTTISDIDAANTVGNDTAYSTRTAQTKLYIDNEETIVLAGLIKQYRSETVRKLPFLGDIPLLGALFRSRSNPTADQDQEVVISLTPTILAKNRSGQDREKEEAQRQKEAFQSQPKSPQVNPYHAVYSTGDSSVDRKTAFSYPGISGEMAEYAHSVQQKIAQGIVYPTEAEKNGLEGAVKVGLLILNDGTLATALIRESSGYEVFDEYALNTARNMAPYDRFPQQTDLKELNVTIPIVYSLKRNQRF